jgi:RimJ/RimL family protein N-acetyltransferase
VTEQRHPATGQPVDATPSPWPGPVTLKGRYGRVERLAQRHAKSFWQQVQDADTIWTYIANSGPFGDRTAFDGWFGKRIAAEDPYAYAILDNEERVVGTAALMSIRPAMRVIEVGSIVYSPALQRTPLGTEAQYLLARYAFETLRYRRYEWKCDSLNAPSRRAALRYGFAFEGIFRQHMISNGRNRDTAWFAMLDGDWPARKAAFERWLAPENFDAAGKQIESLARLNGSA